MILSSYVVIARNFKHIFQSGSELFTFKITSMSRDDYKWLDDFYSTCQQKHFYVNNIILEFSHRGYVNSCDGCIRNFKTLSK